MKDALNSTTNFVTVLVTIGTLALAIVALIKGINSVPPIITALWLPILTATFLVKGMKNSAGKNEEINLDKLEAKLSTGQEG